MYSLIIVIRTAQSAKDLEKASKSLSRAYLKRHSPKCLFFQPASRKPKPMPSLDFSDRALHSLALNSLQKLCEGGSRRCPRIAAFAADTYVSQSFRIAG